MSFKKFAMFCLFCFLPNLASAQYTPQFERLREERAKAIKEARKMKEASVVLPDIKLTHAMVLILNEVSRYFLREFYQKQSAVYITI